jgi:hypothetical protein
VPRLPGRCLGNSRHPVFRDDGVFIECGNPSGIEFVATPAIARWCAFNAQAFSPVQYDQITGFDMFDARACLNHFGRRFMSQQVGQEFVFTLGAVDLTEL